MRKQLLFACLGLLAACSSGDDSTSETNGNKNDPTSFLSGLGSVECTQLFACCSATDLSKKFAGVTPAVIDETSCEQAFRLLGLIALAIQNAEQAGRVVYHADRAQACLDTIKGQSCGDFAMSTFAICDGVLEGKVPLAAACEQDFECAEGTCQNHECQAPAALGQPCIEDCATGRFCEAGTTGSGAVCVAALPDGAKCDFGNECLGGACVGGVCGKSMACTEPLLGAKCGPCTVP